MSDPARDPIEVLRAWEVVTRDRRPMAEPLDEIVEAALAAGRREVREEASHRGKSWGKYEAEPSASALRQEAIMLALVSIARSLEAPRG
jgi:hypothetical protein